MAVFRAEDDSDYEENELTDDNEESYYRAGEEQPDDNERDQLDRQRHQFNQNGINYGNGNSSNQERQALDKVDGQNKDLSRQDRNQGDNQQSPQTTEQSTRKSSAPTSNPQKRSPLTNPKSKINKKVAIGLGVFLMPTLIGLALFLFAFQAGLTLEHIHRVTTGLRFGSMHYMLSQRFNHLRREHVRLTQYQASSGNQLAKYTRTTLGSRLLGVTPDKIYRNLNTKGFKLEYTTLRGGSIATKGRRTLTKVTYPNGEVRNIKSTAEALDFVRNVRTSFDDLEVSRFRAARAGLLLAKQIGIPFLRFRVIIDGLKDGSLRNAVRGSPTNFVAQRISEEILDNKQRLANKLPRLKATLAKFGADDLIETTKIDAAKNLDQSIMVEKLRKAFDSRQAIMKTATVGSIAVSVLTLACVVREIGSMIRQAFKMKIRGLQDSAATLSTTTSQIKAGDMDSEVVGNMTGMFNGFATSATYQAAIQGQPVENLVDVENSDFSQTFSPNSSFSGFVTNALFRFSSFLSPTNLLATILDYLKTNVSLLQGLIEKSGGLQLAANILETQFRESCKIVLNSAFQFGILAIEILATIIASIFTGGVAAGAKIGVGQIVKEVTKVIARPVIGGLVGGIALDILLFDHLLPGMVRNATGMDTALTLGNESNGAGNLAATGYGISYLNTGETLGQAVAQTQNYGARNYAIVDYGMHYLSMGEALGSGGSRIPVAQAVAQTQNYLAKQRLQYADKGLLNNIFAVDNPYSLTSSVVVAQSGQGSWQQKSQSYLASLFTDLTEDLDYFQPVYAQTGNNELLNELLYPGQQETIGFNEAEMNGESELFAHEKNTIYVERNIAYLSNEYSVCLGIGAAEFLLTQVEAKFDEYGHEYYPEKCDRVEARRYKTYYQDCTLIENIRLWGSNNSPMFSGQCDHLLSLPDQDLLNEPLEDYTGAVNLNYQTQNEISNILTAEMMSDFTKVNTSQLKDSYPPSESLVYLKGLPLVFNFNFRYA